MLGFFRAAGLRREPSGETGQHLDHRRGRARARAHRAAEFAQEQHLGGFEGFVGVLPHPRSFGVRAAEGGLHGGTQSTAIERAALTEQLREQCRGMKKPRNLVGRGLRQEQRERGRGGLRKAEHAGDLRRAGFGEPGQALSFSVRVSPASRLRFSSPPLSAERSNEKGPRGGGPGFGRFLLLADAAVDRRNRVRSGVPPLASVT